MVSNKPFVFTITISLLIFIFITVMAVTKSFVFDEMIMKWASESTSPFFFGFMKFISIIGSSEAILLITGVITAIFLLKRDWFHTLFFLTVSVGGVVLNFLLKMLISRERPGEVGSTIDVFNISLEIPSYSFPSGHTMRSTILFLFLLYIIYRFIRNEAIKVGLYITSILLILGVALSRIMLDFHFLSDVIGAISISIVWFCVCLLVYSQIENKKLKTLKLHN